MKRWTAALLASLALVPSAHAQDKGETAEKRQAITPLKVLVVFSRYQGEKKVASLPYTLTCNADDKNAAMLRMGIEVPVSVLEPIKERAVAFPSFQYKNVGTAIDCRATTVDGGRFRLEVNVEQSSIYSTVDEKARQAQVPEGPPAWGVADTPPPNVPVFRTFRSTFAPILRDGQSAQYTAATDPVIGEVVKIDVTVTVLK
jgi:hypothetical protein